MSTLTISSGDYVDKDPADVKVYTFDWDTNNLAPTVIIQTSVFTITPVRPSVHDATLLMDDQAIIAGSRKTQVRLSGGRVGQTYEVANKITTSESPQQTKERSFRIVIRDL